MSCPIDISHAGISLSPLSLFTLLTAITNHTHIHPLLFRHNEHEFSIDFHPSMAVFTPNEMKNRTKYPSSFCHFQGANQDGFRAWLSTCRVESIEMIMNAPFASFTLELDGTFSLISSRNDSCDQLSTHLSKRDVVKDTIFKPYAQTLPEYYNKYNHLLSRKRFVEYAMFGDYTLWKKYGWNEEKTKNRMVTALHMMNSYYDSLNIEIRLVHLSIIKSPYAMNLRNKFTALRSFMKYIDENFNDLHCDNANLMIGDRQIRRELGVAWEGKMCSPESSRMSVNWVQDIDTSAHVSFVMAHEMGHSLGMLHDEYPRCECPMTHCIMNPTEIADTHMQYWSSCSLANLEHAFKTGADYCLWSEPEMTIEDEEPVCGNGIVEKGEECDCGKLGCITHKCCDANTCKFRAGASCASGACCNVTACSVAPSTRLCREAKNTCDLPEYCDGVNVECTAVDKHLSDGYTCPEDKNAICYGGRCGSRKLQCKEMWGEKSRPSPDSCYEEGNMCKSPKTIGMPQGEGEQLQARFDLSPSVMCAEEDKLCGLLHCRVKNLDPLLGHIRGWFYFPTPEDKCKMMLAGYQEDHKPDYYMGMTPDGASCGDGKMCIKQKCVNSSMARPYKPEPERDPDSESIANPGICWVLGFLVFRM